jgi:hypothetical protein
MLDRFRGTIRTILILLCAAGAGGAASIAIAGDAADAGTVSMTAKGFDTSQKAGTVTVKLQRTGGATGAVSVGYNTANGSAVAGSSYTEESGRVSWADGDAAVKSVTIPISNATPFAGKKTFYFELCCAKGVALTTPATSDVTITGDADLEAGTLSFTASAYAAAQVNGEVIITVDRKGGTKGAAKIGYGTGNSTAIAGKDYTARSGVLTWANGDESPKTFTVPISKAKSFWGIKKFAIALAGARGASLGSTTRGTVDISGALNTGVANLSWTAPTKNTNGTKLTNLAGFHLKYGTSETELTHSITITDPKTTSFEISSLRQGKWYFAVAAYNTDGTESALTAIGSTTI